MNTKTARESSKNQIGLLDDQNARKTELFSSFSMYYIEFVC